MKDFLTRAALNHHVPDAARLWAQIGRLPGIAPIAPADWLWVLDSYDAQMAQRRWHVRHRPARVLGQCAGAGEAVAELYETVLDHLSAREDFRRIGETMLCPDGEAVSLDPTQPLATLGRLVQEDLCILQRPQDGAEHLLSAAVLCFPANWTLAQKLGRPMLRIHRPVDVYDQTLARRVQRLLDGVQPDRPLMRANFHRVSDPTLFQPEREEAKQPAQTGPFIRSERQCLLRLPQSGAVVFSIHTILLSDAQMSAPTRAALPTGLHHSPSRARDAQATDRAGTR